MSDKKYGSTYDNNITSTRLTRLWGRNEEETAASFNIYVSGNQVRIQVYTGLQDDKNKKVNSIKVNFKDQQIPSFLAALDMLRDLALHQDDGEAKVIPCPIFGYIKPQGGKAERREIAKLLLGRNKKGVYYISLINSTHGRVMFPLTFDRDFQVYNVNTNEPADEAWVSRCFMLSWVNDMKDVLKGTLIQEYVDKQDDKGGNNNKSGGSSQKSSSSNFDAEEWDDMMP